MSLIKIMADNKKNNKIFSEEDFDKPSQELAWYKVTWKKTFAGIIIVAAIIAIVFFATKRRASISPEGQGGQVADTISAIDSTSVKLTVAKDTTSVLSEVTDDATPAEKQDISNDNENRLESTQKQSNIGKTKSATTDMPIEATADVEAEALSVIRGDYGNNPDRRRLLKERYQEIQDKVNEMYRNGQVH